MANRLPPLPRSAAGPHQASNIQPPETDFDLSLLGQLGKTTAQVQQIESAVQHWGPARLAAFPSLNPNPALECDAQGRITFANPAAARLLSEFTAEQALPAKLRELAGHNLEKNLAVYGLETRCGHKTLLWSVHPCPVAGRLYLFAVDVTERKQLQSQLRQMQKMDAVGRLTGGVAHDFNNLLMVILEYCQLLLNRVDESEPLRASLREIQRAADRAASLTRQFLAFSRKQTLKPKALDVNAVVAGIEKMLRRVIGEDIEVATVRAPKLGRAKADPGQIEQILLNLAVNAREAMPCGGKFTIETANLELHEPNPREPTPLPPGSYVLLAISDTGCGMDADTQSRIFEPFFTTKENGKGNGLGLAIVFGVVRQLDGHIRVSSELARGTTFKVYLPRAKPARRRAKTCKQPPTPAPGSATILLVEDEDAVRKVEREFLEMSGYTVLDARNPGEALEVCGRHPGRIHLLVTDVVMPQMSGDELASRLTSQRPEMKVLYVSGRTESLSVRHRPSDPVTPFLRKPFTLDALARLASTVLMRERKI